ncbi:PAS domain-containing sensor histidine kinase [Geoalkalibacter halelectricus]|uniref:HAMP domain-containing histidine kinase n=1 Tax=Geoalkalibacter halelectricus TaxID=2847045 RepID=A0ABY5ZPZ0_9BACT|nr:HAMP domain-containing sensor histidine kinase [Geoalkalibacter halelectricus]MDO3376929.1 HAMP domain-containing histidine kinase [Geoalkalibacter halelectricus]UWZ81153.1 HAMP domain-containing histidine kinase [Geoalkalibacter halelectricus]
MEMHSLTTCHAPPERADGEELRVQAGLFARNDLSRELLDAVPTLLAILNAQRQIVFSNRALLNFLATTDESTGRGLRPGELFGCTNARLMPAGCGTAEACRTCGAVNAILNGLAGRGDSQEYRLTRQDQGHHQALDLRIHTTPLRHQNQQFVVFTIEDISHQKRRSALERIFFHDILNLAGSVQGFCQLLADQPGDPDAPEMLRLIDSASSQVVEEIKAQRTLLAAENRELQVNFEPLNARAMIVQAMETYRRHPSAQGKQILTESNGQDLWFQSDPTLLGRVLGNMVKNALEACREGETVRAGCRLANDYVQFWVHNPAAIPRDIQLQLFQRSFSTKGPGRGLGTYSMRLLTEEYLDGTISFTSTPEEGTTFQAAFPLNLPFAPPRGA